MAYSEAHYDFNRGKYIESIPLFQRAIEIDPNFAAAYDGLSTAYANTHESKLDIANITKAYALRDHASELERLHIEMRYNSSVLGDIDETIRVLRAWTELYPDDASAWANLTNQEVWLGENAAAMRDGQHAVSLNPTMESAYVALATAYVHSGRLGPAAATCAQSVARHLDGFGTHRVLYEIAFLHRDTAAMQHEMDWASGKPAERFMLTEAWQTALSEGQIQKGLDSFARALNIGKSLGLGNYMAGSNARTLYDLGAKDRALETLDQAPAGFDSADYRFDLMEFGDEAKGKALLDAALAKSPSDTLLNRDFAPQDLAISALRHNQPVEAVKAMAPPSGLIETHTFDASYVYGEAYLAGGDASNAAMEFRKIADNPTFDPVSPLYPLAWLGLARALHREGDASGSRAAYRKLFALWKDADNNLPALQDAKREFASLSPS
jgi:eukaryotic-like serine/threonine-protein kinase